MKQLVVHTWGWINQRVGWIELSGIGRHRAARSAFVWLAIVPIAAKALERIPPTVTIPLTESRIKLALSLPFSWQCFYFSAVAISIGSLIYTARCPQLIRAYRDYPDFVRRTGPSELLLRVAIGRAAQFRNDNNDARMVEFCRAFCSKDEEGYRVNVGNLLTVFKVKEAEIPNAFAYAQGNAAHFFPFARALCAVSYAIGFTLLAYVFLDSALFVLRYVASA